MKVLSNKIIIKKIQAAKNFFLPTSENKFYPRVFEGSFLINFLIVLIALKGTAVLILGGFPKNDFFADLTKSAIVELTNHDRQQAGLAPLKEDPVLERAALMKANDMMSKGYFDHTSPQGTTPWYWFDASGYNYQYAGENLAIGFIDSNEVNNAWLASPTHRANIMDSNYQDIGIAVLTGDFQGKSTTIIVQLFGKPIDNFYSAPHISSTVDTKNTAVDNNFNFNNNTFAATAALNINAFTPRALEFSKLGAAAASILQRPNPASLSYQLAVFWQKGYFTASQFFIYFSLLAVIILLIINFAMKANFANREALFKIAGFIIVAGVFLAIDKQTILAILPHLAMIK